MANDQSRRYAEIALSPAKEELLAPLLKSPVFLRRMFLHKLVNPRYPRFFYRYTRFSHDNPDSLIRLKELVVDSLLWLSSPADFNDPFDMSSKSEFSGTGPQRVEALKLRFKNHKKISWKERQKRILQLASNPGVSAQYFQALIEGYVDNLGVCCFTPKPKNLLMWSHYAANHSGVALQFQTALDPKTFLEPMRVSYCQDFPSIDWHHYEYTQLESILLRKSPEWAYEDEWRLICVNSANSYLPFSPKSLTGILIGCRAGDEDISAIRAVLHERRSRGFPDVSLYKAQKNPGKYKLDFRKIS